MIPAPHHEPPVGEAVNENGFTDWHIVSLLLILSGKGFMTGLETVISFVAVYELPLPPISVMVTVYKVVAVGHTT